MKIYISADLEGIAGVVARDQLGGTSDNYRRARKLMTDEVNAAALGAIDAGADQVVVNDSHASMTNILIEDLHEEVRLISGQPKALSMMAGISSEYDMAFLIGYHARQGEKGTLSHTYSSTTIGQFKFNGQVVGELGLSALIAGYFGVPIGLVSGDDAVCSEAQELFGDSGKLAAVKKNLAHRAAESLSPLQAGRLIREQARQAVSAKESVKPLTLKSPATLEITFLNRGMAEEAALMPGAEIVSGSTVKFTHHDTREVIAGLEVMVTMAMSIPSDI